ncbi:MAG: dipeptidyl aminopeptidase, partial [Gammaproteobacteria bacterium]|nr:dipeptidyl aminopeptidase [Gammaproteobacteria bacterium]
MKLRFIALILVVSVVLPFTDPSASEYGKQQQAVLALGDLTTAPKTHDEEGQAATIAAGELKAIYFDALDYKGKPTRVFAWLGIPEGASPENPVPAIVLVQGGGGTAFRQWVQMWNNRGYAAISIAVEGQTDEATGNRPPDKWKKHAWPGPSRQGIYHDSGEPLRKQWMFHALADTVLANSLIHSLPEVD